MGAIGLMLGFLHAVLLPRTALIAENLALRQQLAVLRVSAERPRLRRRDILCSCCRRQRGWLGSCPTGCPAR